MTCSGYIAVQTSHGKVFGNAGEVILNGLKQYHDEVIGRQFPQKENWFGMQDAEYDELLKLMG